jgi:hypothetical protein
MQPTKRLTVFILLLLLAGLALGLSRTDRSLAAGDGNGKIEDALMQHLLAEGQADFIVRFAEQADLSAAYAMDWNERGWYVYNTLTETAQRSQARAQAYLDDQGLTYRSFFAGNELYVYAGSLEQASGLARLSEVANLYVPPTYSITPVETVNPLLTSTWAGELLSNHTEVTVLLPDVVGWNIDNVNADAFWTTFNVRGEGILVANIDTGVRYTHEALYTKYACYGLSSHTNCWKDPDGLLSVPTDGNGHGTHTMGTMVGLSPSGIYQIGMAPDARWIACQGCDGAGCEADDLSACADWILAPGGSPENRPQVVNNSWGSSEDGLSTWFQDKVIAWRAAGIFPAFSAGNNGPECDTLVDPGSFQESFASAAHDIFGIEYSFGSRGPSVWGHDPYTKPNLSAPGVNVTSSYNTTDTSYIAMYGTSMATPHSAGAVALLWSCNSDLVGQIDTTFQLLQNSARVPRLSTCGTPPDLEGNYSFGYGYLDVLSAGYSVCDGALTGVLQGHVYDTQGNPLAEATVTISSSPENSFQTLTNSSGAYSIRLPVGVYDITAFLNGYLANTVSSVGVMLAETTTQDVSLVFLGLWTPQIWSPCTNLTRFDAEYFPGTGLVYILGGRYVYANDSQVTVDTTVGTIFAFDPLTGLCADTYADMPIPVSNYTISLINFNGDDVLCTFGGRTATGTQTLAVQCYDPVENIAVQITSLPAAYTGYAPGAQVVYHNRVYLFGGINPTAQPYHLARTERYDPLTNSFTQLGNLSQARAYILAAVVDGHIYAFGGDVYNGTGLTAQVTAEVMLEPEGAGTWDDAAVADLPLAAGEGRAFGFDSDSGYDLAGKIAIATMAQWVGSSYEVITYDILSDTYNLNYPNLNVSRRNHAAVFIPINTPEPLDGLPGMWVLGGFCTGGTCGGDLQPYGIPEFFPVNLVKHYYMPFIFK